MVMKRTPKEKHSKSREWRRVYLIVAGKNLEPDRVSKALGILPDSSGKRGEPYRRNRKSKQGFWCLEQGPTTWRLETQMKAMLKRIAPVRHRLRKLIRADETIKEAYLQLAFAPPRRVANACYCFDAKLINEFTSMGLDIALSIQIIGEWEKIFKSVDRKRRQRGKSPRRSGSH